MNMMNTVASAAVGAAMGAAAMYAATHDQRQVRKAIAQNDPRRREGAAGPGGHGQQVHPLTGPAAASRTQKQPRKQRGCFCVCTAVGRLRLQASGPR